MRDEIQWREPRKEVELETGAAGGKDHAREALAIAIDGPAASGKSTIGRALADALNLLYLDTGAMYRAVTWMALQRKIDPGDERRIADLATGARFEFPELTEGAHVNPPILIDGVDATDGIREPAVDSAVSVVSSYPEVRNALVREQRQIARARGVVMVGRDIGTVVLPDADVKIFLIARPEERARRRYEERLAAGSPVDYEETRDAMMRRDTFDSARAHSPLQPADDAALLDTTSLSIHEVVARSLALAEAAQARRGTR